MRYYVTTYTYTCPHCKNIVKTTQNSDAWALILVILFPIGLLYLICKLIANSVKEKTSAGEEIMTCKHCGKRLAISHSSVRSYTRVLLSREDMISLVSPSLMLLEQNRISCDIYNPSKDLPKDILLMQFINTANNKQCEASIVSLTGLNIIFNKKNYLYSHETLFNLIKNALD